MTELLPEQVSRHEMELDNHEVRITNVEGTLYGTERPRSDGLVIAFEDIKIQIGRQVLMTFALLGISLILLITVAMAVLL